ncbi:MAG TPA: hypothetical protein VJU34_12950 [Phenylobacterium sp.]|nr:hypothetical protein [Phenylobacterium sp.]
MFTPEVFYGLGALLLLAALVWGITQYKRRNRANDAVSEQATRAEYDHPDTYEREEQAFRDKIRPS